MGEKDTDEKKLVMYDLEEETFTDIVVQGILEDENYT